MCATCIADFVLFIVRQVRQKAMCLPMKTIFQKIQETMDVDGTEILMQGGTNPDLPFTYYLDLLRKIKEHFQSITMHSFSPAEILKMHEVSGGLSLEEVVRQLHEAGLDSLPGGGAEILDDRTRREDQSFEGFLDGLDGRHEDCASHRYEYDGNDGYRLW